MMKQDNDAEDLDQPYDMEWLESLPQFTRKKARRKADRELFATDGRMSIYPYNHMNWCLVNHDEEPRGDHLFVPAPQTKRNVLKLLDVFIRRDQDE